VQQGVKILVVDDEPTVRNAMKLLLEHGGGKVNIAEDGEAGLSQLAQQRFDVVITDYSMPGMRGDRFVARVRELLPAQPIIMATAFVEDYIAFADPSAKVDALLFKPFSLRELYSTIDRVMESKNQPVTAA